MTNKRCPYCGLWVSGSATRCVCGHVFKPSPSRPAAASVRLAPPRPSGELPQSAPRKPPTIVDKRCPHCGRWCDGVAESCGCGYSFTRRRQRPAAKSGRPAMTRPSRQPAPGVSPEPLAIVDKRCPRCGRWCDGVAESCECGYSFTSGIVILKPRSGASRRGWSLEDHLLFTPLKWLLGRLLVLLIVSALGLVWTRLEAWPDGIWIVVGLLALASGVVVYVAYELWHLDHPHTGHRGVDNARRQ